MVDNPTAQATCGSIFNYVLVASERTKEIHQQRKTSGLSGLPTTEYRKLEKIHTQVAREIQEGTVGLEYLLRISDRHNKQKDKMR
jgi:hypothetical protein